LPNLSLSLIEERELADGWQQVLAVNLSGRPLHLHQQVRTLGASTPAIHR